MSWGYEKEKEGYKAPDNEVIFVLIERPFVSGIE